MCQNQTSVQTGRRSEANHAASLDHVVDALRRDRRGVTPVIFQEQIGGTPIVGLAGHVVGVIPVRAAITKS